MHPDFSKLKAVQAPSTSGNTPDFAHLKPIDATNGDFGAASQSLSGSKSGLSHSNSLLSQFTNPKDNSALGETKNFVGALGQNIAKDFIDPAEKFIASGAQAAGFGTKEGGNFTSGAPATTYQQDASKDVSQGDSATQSIVKEGTNTVLGALDTLGLGEGANALKGELTDFLAPKLQKLAGEQAGRDALEVVTPKLSKTETEEALSQGRGKTSGIFGKTTITPDKQTLDAAQAVKGVVKKGATGAENIKAVKNALSTEAESLKTQIQSVDHPYTFKELSSKLNAVEEPAMLKTGNLDKVFDRVKTKAMSIAQDAGGKVSNLLDARKSFDSYVDKEFPNLYSSDTLTPMKTAIKGIRGAMNDFIQENLPDDVKFKGSLKKQSDMYNAIENIAGKTADEVGSSKVGRFVKKVLKNPLVRYGGSAVVGGEAAKHL